MKRRNEKTADSGAMMNAPIKLPTSVGILANQAKREYADLRALGRRTVEQAWRVGRTLAALKAECKHGQWLPILDAYDIPERTAQLLMKLHAKYAKSENLADFDSVAEALRPAALPEPTGDDTPAEESTLAARVLSWHMHDVWRHLNLKAERPAAIYERIERLPSDDVESNDVALDLSAIANGLLRKLIGLNALDDAAKNQVVEGEIAKAEGLVNLAIDGYDVIETDGIYGSRKWNTPPREWCDLFRRSSCLPALTGSTRQRS